MQLNRDSRIAIGDASFGDYQHEYQHFGACIVCLQCYFAAGALSIIVGQILEGLGLQGLVDLKLKLIYQT